ncbi:hypothetical protein ILYODFUR_001032 [Ilyodon furcidens]|uniref:Uncharacterized protein n=1 Tax=Ilyodon furcidens TaxID=33524 RepID=A0ABV0T5N2_9TELE
MKLTVKPNKATLPQVFTSKDIYAYGCDCRGNCLLILLHHCLPTTQGDWQSSMTAGGRANATTTPAPSSSCLPLTTICPPASMGAA